SSGSRGRQQRADHCGVHEGAVGKVDEHARVLACGIQRLGQGRLSAQIVLARQAHDGEPGRWMRDRDRAGFIQLVAGGARLLLIWYHGNVLLHAASRRVGGNAYEYEFRSSAGSTGEATTIPLDRAPQVTTAVKGRRQPQPQVAASTER